MKKLLIAMLSLLAVLAGCGNSDNSDSSSGDTMTYEAANGTVEYKANPRVYADYNVGEWLYLDADLVGADMTYPADSWADVAKERNVENISEDMEAIANLQPDLIYTIHEDFVDQYETIAPTIYIPFGTYNPEELVLEIGKILGKDDEAQEWQDSFNQGIEDLKKEIDNPDLTISIVDAWRGEPTMYGANYGRGGYILYNKLGLKGPEQAETDYIRKDDSYVRVDSESILNYIGDVLFIVDNGEGSLEAVEDLPTYEDFKAVQEGNVVVIDDNVFSDSDPYSLNNQLTALQEIYASDEL